MRAQRLNEGWSILNRKAKRSNEGLEHTTCTVDEGAEIK